MTQISRQQQHRSLCHHRHRHHLEGYTHGVLAQANRIRAGLLGPGQRGEVGQF
jgi:hypothetical protein